MVHIQRWQQRLNNLIKANQKLSDAICLSKSRELSDLEKQGLIQAFEFTHELAWQLMKDYFNFQGNTDIMGSRDAIREAFNKGLITDGETWMETIVSRNKTSHTYNESVANDIVNHIINQYGYIFEQLIEKMKAIASLNPS